MTKALTLEIDSAITVERNKAHNYKKNYDYESAEIHYLKAWDLLPEPKYDWDVSQILIYRISDFYLEWKKFETAIEWAKQVFRTSPSASDGTPHIVFGKIYFESGNVDLALDNFIKAYEVAGKRAFEGEDPKYLKFYREKQAAK